MAISAIPAIISAVISITVIVFYILSIVKIFIAIAEVERVGSNVVAKTQFMKEMTVKAESLYKRTETAELKLLSKKVYEAIRFSDFVSHPALANVEGKIS